MYDDADLDALIDEVVTLPSLSETVLRITDMIKDPECRISEVSKVISNDPSIALKTLRLINSAFYALPQRIVSIEHAVAMLGLDVVRNIVFTASVFNTLRSEVEQFVRHSVGCGVAMRLLVEDASADAQGITPDEAFVFGLLHDIGKVIFEQFLPKKFTHVLVASQTREIAWYQLEREILGADHGVMGARLVAHWNLPQGLADSIAGHHDLSMCDDPSNRPLAAVLSIADYVCSEAGYPACPNAVVVVSEEARETVRLDGKSLEPILARFADSASFIEELASIAG